MKIILNTCVGGSRLSTNRLPTAVLAKIYTFQADFGALHQARHRALT